MTRRDVALQVDRDHGVPLLLGQVEAHGIAEDAGVVHEDVEAPVLIDRLVHEAFGPGPARDVVVVRDGHTTGVHDLVDHRVAVGIEVVHEHACALGREQSRVAASDAAPGAGDDRDLAVEHAHARRVSYDADVRCNRGAGACRSGRGEDDDLAREDQARIAGAQRRRGSHP